LKDSFDIGDLLLLLIDALDLEDILLRLECLDAGESFFGDGLALLAEIDRLLCTEIDLLLFYNPSLISLVGLEL